jgi:CRP/FNR family transcriptional regulator, cyclic AMP receptor protein
MSVDQSKLTEVLRGVPLFRTLNQRHLRGVAKECHESHYAAGEVLLRELDWGQHMIVITAGTADVIRNERPLATVGPGEAVGEMSLLDDEPRSATVVAREPVTGLVLYKTAFRALLEANPSMCTQLLLAQTARLREADKRAAVTG